MNRSWPYGLFVAVISGVSIFIERPYLQIHLPLGCFTSHSSTFRWFGLKRKQDCDELPKPVPLAAVLRRSMWMAVLTIASACTASIA